MSKYIVDIKGEIEGDYEIIGKYEENPTGHWILKQEDVDNGGNNRYQCSVCGYMDIHTDSIDVPYCWHCGSKLETEVSDDD